MAKTVSNSNDAYSLLEKYGVESKVVTSETNYQKVRLTLPSGEVEYIEEFLNADGSYSFRTTNKAGAYKIAREDNNVVAVNELTKEKSILAEDVDSSFTKVKFNPQDGNQLSVPSDYSYLYSYQGSESIDRSVLSFIVATLASIVNAAAGAVASVAGFYSSISAPHIYHLTGVWEKRINIWSVNRINVSNFYQYHDLTGFIETVEGDPYTVSAN